MGKYTGRKAVVTGGTHGMGLATVKALHLTEAAILVSRGIKVLQAAPAGELYH